MFAKKNIRTHYKSNRRFSLKRNNSSFSNNQTRVKGNISQVYDKFLKLAKVASSSGDRIQAEYYYQFADHYARLMIENGIKVTESFSDSDESNEQLSKNDEVISKDNIKNDKENSDQSSITLKNNSINTDDSKLDNEEYEDSIESVPFITQSIKKNIKSKKS